jgi:iron(III) transport system ATP-binding protein
MRAGKIVETGDPRQIYFRSGDRFVADFIGRANLIPGKVAALEGSHAVVETDIGTIVGLNRQGIVPGKEAVLCVRPEFIRTAITGAAGDRNLFRGKIETLLFIGEAYEGEIRIGDTLLTTTISPMVDLVEGGDIRIAFDPDHCFLLPA